MSATELNVRNLSHRTVFVDVNWFRAEFGISADQVYAAVDAREWKLSALNCQWVFDIGTGFGNDDTQRELRFWLREYLAPLMTRDLTIAKALESIVPKKPVFNGSDIAQLFLISRPTVLLLAPKLTAKIHRGTYQISRASLLKFLETRWTGNIPTLFNQPPKKGVLV